MTKAEMEYEHTKTALYARDVNKDCKIITFCHLNSSDFNDNFKVNFMLEIVKSILVVLILSFASFFPFHHLYVWEHSQIAF